MAETSSMWHRRLRQNVVVGYVDILRGLVHHCCGFWRDKAQHINDGRRSIRRVRAQKLSFFNWWMFCLFFGVLFASTFLIYIQDNVGWSIGYALPTAALASSIFLFLLGTPFYRHKLPAGSPINRLLQVFVAAVRKWRVSVPCDPQELHELTMLDYYNNDGGKRRRIRHTSSLR